MRGVPHTRGYPLIRNSVTAEGLLLVRKLLTPSTYANQTEATDWTYCNPIYPTGCRLSS